MKKNNIIIMIFIMILATLFSLCSCALDKKSDYQIKETDLYEYYIQNDEVEICGLTAEGQRQQTLIVPAKIENYSVTRFGGKNSSSWDHIHSQKLKKIIFQSNKTFYQLINEGGCPFLDMVIFVDFDTSMFTNKYIDHFKYYFAPKEICPTIMNIMGVSSNCNNILESNVTYLYNYENAPNEGVFMVDHLSEGESFYCPYDPEREGYVFEGWSLENGDELIVNFDNLIMTNSYVTFYACWKEKN